MRKAKKSCPYCGHKLGIHTKTAGCEEVVPSSLGTSYTDQCRCTRYPDKAGRWRR